MPASVAVLAILWAVAVWRAPTAWQEPWKRAPWLSVVCLAAALTADLPPVTGFIDGATGMPELATLIKVLGGTGAVAAATAGVRAARSPSRPTTLLDARHLPAAVTMLALTAVWAVMPRREVPDFTRAVTGGLPAVFLLIFYAYLALALPVAAVMYGQASRVRSLPSARAGMLLVAAGCVCGVGFAGWMITYLALRMAGTSLPGGVTGYLARAGTLEDLAILLMLAGVSLPACGVGAAAGRDLLALRALHPLWRDVTDAVPEVSAGPWPRGLAGIRDPHVRLIRRVAEIRDAALVLRRYVPPPVITQAREHLTRQGLAGPPLRAAAEACWLELAIRARHDRQRPVWDPHLLPGGAELRSEVTWLRQVAAARRSPAFWGAITAIQQAVPQRQPG